jgi:hypothetical protein
LRAFTGAELYLDKRFTTLAKTAEACGSNVTYIRAALVLIKNGDQMTREEVLTGHLPLLVVANRARRRRKAERITPAEAVMGWKRWTPEQRAEFGRVAGVAEIWDCAISPVINEERVAAE